MTKLFHIWDLARDLFLLEDVEVKSGDHETINQLATAVANLQFFAPLEVFVGDSVVYSAHWFLHDEGEEPREKEPWNQDRIADAITEALK